MNLMIYILAAVLLTDGEVKIEGEKQIDISRSMTIKVTPRGIDLRERFRGFSVADDFENETENCTEWLLTPKPCEKVYKLAPFAYEGRVIGPLYFDPPAPREVVTGGMEVNPTKDLPPFSWKLIGEIAIGLLGLAVLLALAYYLLRLLFRKVKEHRMSPIERAWVELDRLIAKGLPGRGRYKDFYVELTMVVRRYIQRKYGIRAPNMTTEEFLAKFRDSCTNPEPRTPNPELKAFLESADMVKFAGLEATPEMADNATESARGYLKGDSQNPNQPQTTVCSWLALASIVGMTMSAMAVTPLDEVPWIGDGQPDRNGADWYAEDPAPEFTAEFTLPEGVTATKIHFACAGFGCFSVRGAYLDTDGLEPMWSVYDKTVYYTTTPTIRDVEKYPKKNQVIVRLGNGFYNLPPMMFWGCICFREALTHGRPCFKMAIDGVKEPLVWKWRPTRVVRNCVYLGTEIDATRPEATEWRPAAVVKGPNGQLREWANSNPRTSSGWDHVFGKARWLKEGEVQVVDFGTNASGVPEFVFRNEQRGTKIEIVYGERLNADGSVNVLTQTAGQIKEGNGGSGAPALACQRDAYICRGPQKLPPNCIVCDRDPSVERFRPPFTWHVFRYAEVRGAKHLLKAGDAGRSDLSMFPAMTEFAVEPAKSFKSDNADLQRIHEMCRRTFRANLIGGVQSDCPGRERLNYGGDIAATCEAMCLNFDMKELYLKILRDFADEAADTGWITETAPYVGIGDTEGLGSGMGRKIHKGPISWSIVVPVLMDTLMRHYPEVKNRALEFYPTCTRYIALLAAENPSGIIPKCIGDHEALERAPNEVTATAHWHEFVRLTASFARMLDKAEDASRYEALAKQIRGTFAAAFVKDGKVANGTQSAQALALYLGLVPSAQIPAAEKLLIEAIHAKGDAVTTGLFTTRYMLVYLAEHGYNELARKIVLHRGFPGWLYMLERGATTVWETWKESDNIYSNCHPMFGSVDEWILKYSGK